MKTKSLHIPEKLHKKIMLDLDKSNKKALVKKTFKARIVEIIQKGLEAENSEV